MDTSVVWNRSAPSHEHSYWLTFIDFLIDGIFPTKRKAVRRHSLPVAILTRSKEKQMTLNTKNVYFVNANDEQISDTEDFSYGSIARQTVLMPNTQHQVLATTTSPGLLTIGSQHFRSYRQRVLAACGIMKASPEQPFYILVSDNPST